MRAKIRTHQREKRMTMEDDAMQHYPRFRELQETIKIIRECKK